MVHEGFALWFSLTFIYSLCQSYGVKGCHLIQNPCKPSHVRIHGFNLTAIPQSELEELIDNYPDYTLDKAPDSVIIFYQIENTDLIITDMHSVQFLFLFFKHYQSDYWVDISRLFYWVVKRFWLSSLVCNLECFSFCTNIKTPSQWNY